MKVVNETKQILNDKRGWKRERQRERERERQRQKHVHIWTMQMVICHI